MKAEACYPDGKFNELLCDELHVLLLWNPMTVIIGVFNIVYLSAFIVRRYTFYKQVEIWKEELLQEGREHKLAVAAVQKRSQREVE